MLGNLRDARIAYRLTHEGGFKKPPSWVMVGEGSTRTAWLSPTRVVYKVPISYWDHETNLEEQDNYLRNKTTKVKGWKLAPCYTHSFKVPGSEMPGQMAHVNAQYYVEGTREKYKLSPGEYIDSDLAKYVEQSFSQFGLADDHLDQYRIVDGVRVIFDYAV